MTPDDEAQAIAIELELRRREREAALQPAPFNPAMASTSSATAPAGSAAPSSTALIPTQTTGTAAPASVPEGDWQGNEKAVLDKIKAVLAEGGGPVAGQAIGAMTGIAAPIAIPVLGAAGGMLGDAYAQSQNGGAIHPGRLIGAGIMGAIPGGSLGKAAAEGAAVQTAKEAAPSIIDRVIGSTLEAATQPGVVKEGLKYGAGNVAANMVQSEIDNGQAPSVSDVALAAASGLAGAGAQKLFTVIPSQTKEDILNSVRNRSLAEVQPFGVVVPPSEIRDGTFWDSVAGKAATGQQAAETNVGAYQKMVRQDLGLPAEAIPFQVDPKTGKFPELDKIRADAAAPYQELQQIKSDADQMDAGLKSQLDTISDPHERQVLMDSPQFQSTQKTVDILKSADVDELKKAREAAQDAYDRLKNGDSTAYDSWIAQKNKASQIEDNIEKAAVELGDPSLLQRLQAARQQIAKVYSVQGSINPGSGWVDPRDFGAQIVAGVPLSGNLRKLGNFALAFTRNAVEGSKIPAPNVGNLGAMNAMQQASRGNLLGVAGGATGMGIGKPIRNILLGEKMQQSLLDPQERAKFVDQFARFLAQQAGTAPDQSAPDDSGAAP